MASGPDVGIQRESAAQIIPGRASRSVAGIEDCGFNVADQDRCATAGWLDFHSSKIAVRFIANIAYIELIVNFVIGVLNAEDVVKFGVFRL